MDTVAAAHHEALAFVDDAVATAGQRLPGIDPEAMRLILLLHRVTNAVVYDIESTVHRPAGWSWSAFRALFTLWVSGPCEPSRLADLSGMSRQAVSALAKTLEHEQLIGRQTSPHDARSVLLTITPTGAEQLEAAFRAHNRREQEWAAILDRSEIETFIALLSKLAAGAQHDWVSHRY